MGKGPWTWEEKQKRRKGKETMIRTTYSPQGKADNKKQKGQGRPGRRKMVGAT